MAESTGDKKGRFEPKNQVKLEPPRDDLITPEHLAKCDGEVLERAPNSGNELTLPPGKNEGFPTYVAIKVHPY
jgi:hypothetical protein